MYTLDFITDDALKEALVADLDELGRCQETKAYKAVLVISGSIIEALLVDSLLAIGLTTSTGKDPLKLELAELITEAKAKNLISSKTADLCSVIRAYRNLIHPGRMTRLQETVDGESAQIAVSLVSIISTEIAIKRQEAFGYTAAQLISKIQSDPSVEAILPHLLTEVKEREIEKLLLTMLPNALRTSLEIDDEPFSSVDNATNGLFRERLSKAFRLAFEYSPESTKQKAVAKYVELVRYGDNHTITWHGNAFFRVADLEYCDTRHLPLMKEHIMSSVLRVLESDELQFLEGIDTQLLSAEDLRRWFNPFVRILSTSKIGVSQRIRILDLFERVAMSVEPSVRTRILEGIDRAIKSAKSISGDNLAVLQLLRETIEQEIPF